MRVFVAPATEPITPLDAPARDSLLLDRTLGETMQSALVSAGLEPTSVGSLEEGEDRARREAAGAFVLLDSVLCSSAALRRFVAFARRRTAPGALVCALPRALSTDLLSHVDGLELREPPAGGNAVWTAPFFFLRGASSSLRGAEPLVLPFKEQILRFPIPPGVIGRSEQVVGVSDSYMCNVSHWVHVWRLNTSAIAGWWFERLRWGVVLGPAWIVWRMLCGFPWAGGRFKGSLRGVSWGASVHHSAHLELAVVQKGAVVGAHASIRNSFVGEGAQIGDGARIFGSVIGKGATVATNAVVFNSVVYPEAFAAQFLMQASLLGRRSSAFSNSAFFDLNFSRNVRVAHRGGYADSGTQFLGVCVGPEARVSAGVWVASGREVPSRALLIMPAAGIVQRMGAPSPEVPHAVRDGALVPVDRG
jgi:hypothetical protein